MEGLETFWVFLSPVLGVVSPRRGPGENMETRKERGEGKWMEMERKQGIKGWREPSKSRRWRQRGEGVSESE